MFYKLLHGRASGIFYIPYLIFSIRSNSPRSFSKWYHTPELGKKGKCKVFFGKLSGGPISVDRKIFRIFFMNYDHESFVLTSVFYFQDYVRKTEWWHSFQILVREWIKRLYRYFTQHVRCKKYYRVQLTESVYRCTRLQ